MSTAETKDVGRLFRSSAVYAAAAVAQRGLAILLLPVYTRFLETWEYGALELLNAFSSLVFGCLILGLPSSLVKCFHTDCESDDDRQRVLPTALTAAAPILLVGLAVLLLGAGKISQIVLGTPDKAILVELVVLTGFISSIVALLTAHVRAEDRAAAFSSLTLGQFGIALVLNIIFVVVLGLGVQGVLMGNLISNIAILFVAILVVRGRVAMRPQARLAIPLLRFGILLVPVVVSGWIINMSDRYVLRLFRDLSAVATYGVGYKFGMMLELLVVWPFQLAWPTISFEASARPGHRDLYSRMLTYLSAVLVYVVIVVSIGAQVTIGPIAGEAYADAFKIVPWVALAYAFGGVQYCVAPGLHIAKKTRYMALLSIVAAVVNLALNFLLIPRWGEMGAAWATTISLFLMAASTAAIAQIAYRVEYDYGRLAKLCALGFGVLIVARQVALADSLGADALALAIALVGFPLLTYLTKLWTDDERLVVASSLHQALEKVRGWK